jgi:hypothetical protein
MNLKKILASLCILTGMLTTAHGQIKITKSTCQKVIAGMGGVAMNYEVGLRIKKADTLVIDSVKTIASGTTVNFSFSKTERTYQEIVFGYSLTAPPKCRTCPDVGLQQINFTKGVYVYYKRGGKASVCKVKKFKQLEDKLLP